VGLAPAGNCPPTEQCFRRPFAKVDRESNAVPIVPAEDHHPFAARMKTENWAHTFRQEDRSTPPMCDPHFSECGMQVSDPAFQPPQPFGSLATANIVAPQIWCGSLG